MFVHILHFEIQVLLVLSTTVVDIYKKVDIIILYSYYTDIEGADRALLTIYPHVLWHIRGPIWT